MVLSLMDDTDSVGDVGNGVDTGEMGVDGDFLSFIEDGRGGAIAIKHTSILLL
jgi:hypothetical protein